MVGNERDSLVFLGAERRSGQGDPAPCRLERFEYRLTPTAALTIGAVVDLVEDHQRFAQFGAASMEDRFRSHLSVGGDVTGETVRHRTDTVRQRGIKGEIHLCGGIGPLSPQVIRGCDHNDLLNKSPAPEFGGDVQGEGGLS